MQQLARALKYKRRLPARTNEIDLVGREEARMYRRCSNCGHFIGGKCLLSGGVATIKGKILQPTSVWCSEWYQIEVVLREPRNE